MVVLTAYLDHGGDLQFHGGLSDKDFERDVEPSLVNRVLKRFWIDGKIVREDGEAEPINVVAGRGRNG